MRLGFLCSHELHKRNLYDSGLVRMLKQRGHTIINVGSNMPTFYRLRRSLRLMTMVHMEPRLRTYAHKATLLTGRRRLQAAIYRELRRLGVDLESVAQRIEARLPIQAHTLHHVEVAKPDVLLWPTLLHMDAVENDIVKAARSLEVPVIGMPASWDNLTTKGQWLVRPDQLIVWGRASQVHAIRYHGFREAQIAVTGPPHFWPYESGVTPPGKEIYVNGTSIHYWRDEDQMVAELRRVLPDVSIEHSLHPRRHGGYYPVTYIKDRLDRAACLVAAFSTTVIEAALCGRPSVLVGFGAGAQGEAMAVLGHHATGVLDHSKYEHMDEVLRIPGVRLARSMDELCAIIRPMLSGSPDPDLAAARRAAALEIADARPGIQDRIVAAIEAAR